MSWSVLGRDLFDMPSLRTARVGIGIDLGTTYSGVAIAFKDQTGQHKRITVRNAANDVKFPSAVYFPLDGSPLIGKEALNRAVAEKRVDEALRTRFKLSMGTDDKFSYIKRGERTPIPITPIELSTILLKSIKQMVEGRLRELNLHEAEKSWVISVPGRWPMASKFATREAAIAAGIDSTSLELVAEPTAAAIATRAAMPNTFLDDSAMLIVDFGGGTLDLSIVRPHENALDVVLAPGGNNQLGGTNVDSALALLIISGFLNTDTYRPHTINRASLNDQLEKIRPEAASRASLEYKAERLKVQISKDMAAGNPENSFPVNVNDISTVNISRTDFEGVLRLTNGEVERSVRAYLQEAEKHDLPASQISRVVLVGGASMLPGIEEAISKVFGRASSSQNKPLVGVRLNPDQRQEMIQLGAAMFAYDKTLIRARVCGSTYGVESSREWREGDDEHLAFNTKDGRKMTKQYTRFFKRNESVSLDGVTQSFSPIEDGQTKITFRVLEGDRDDPTKNKLLGTSTVPVDGSVPRDQVSAMCKFALERGDLMHVYTWNPKTNERGEEVKFEWKPGSIVDWQDG